MFEVSESTVSNIIVTWINCMYFQLKKIDIWPSRSVIDKYMPNDFFANFNKTRVIIDATEVPINKPQNVNAQSATFPSYKNRNTLKIMVGCTPHGAVIYVSDAYCGSTSDRQILKRSDLLKDKDKFQDHDSEEKKTQTHFATDRGSRNKRTKKRFGHTLEANWSVTDKDGELSLQPFSPKVSRAVIKKVTIDAEASLLGSCFGLVAMLRVLKTKKYSADAICNVKVF